MWTMINRAVGFKDGKAVCAGTSVNVATVDSVEVIPLPTDHYDFVGPVIVKGKTREEIIREAEETMRRNKEQA
jgi:hypothetical protein